MNTKNSIQSINRYVEYTTNRYFINLFSGNPVPYCNYIFKAIDTDKSGMINFVEFTKAVALTQSSDLETRLKLVCCIEEKFFWNSSFYIFRFLLFVIRIIRELLVGRKWKKRLKS